MASDTRDETRTVVGASVYAWVSVYLKGFLMGSADSVPGVSGGTIAFILGIYERLITAIAELDPRALGHIPRLHRAEGRRALFEDLLEMDVPFLAVLGIGLASAVVVVSRAVHAALAAERALTFAFFFGLIGASVVVFRDQVSLDSPGRIGAAVAGFGLAFVVSGITTGSDIPHALPVIFVAGIVAISAMILPGVSGAFFLLLLGQYEYLSGVLKSFVDEAIALVLGNATLSSVLEPMVVVATFGVGAVLGVLSLARVIRRALDTYRRATLAFLVSLMAGALRLPAEEMAANTDTLGPVSVGGLLAAVLVGGALVLVLDRYTASMEY
jgi:putative membrane protein